MKKSLLALAVLGAFAGAASAQSSVTLFGVVDVSAADIQNKSNGVSTSVKQLRQDGLQASRLGFRGVEDLGGGLKAGFWLEAGISPDTGVAGASNPSANNTTSNKFFSRRATVSLLGNFGEVRLGRDYDSSYWNLNVFDPFGDQGIAAITQMVSTLGSSAQTVKRVDNSIGYFLPSGIGGFYGQANVAAGEDGQGGTEINNKYAGGRIGYAAGPIDVAGSYGQTWIDNNDQDRFKMWNVGGAFGFGMGKITALVNEAKYGDLKQLLWEIGAVVNVGQGEIHASYIDSNMSGGAAAPYRDEDDSKQYALGYVYNLSKRTGLYGTVSHISNDDGAKLAISNSLGAVTGGTSTGVEVGIRHAF